MIKLETLTYCGKIGYRNTVIDKQLSSEINYFSYHCTAWGENRIQPIIKDGMICYSESDLRTLVRESSKHSATHIGNLDRYLSTAGWR